MVIKLYYIEGISRIDTPYYAKQGQQATLAAQEAFFEDHVVTEIDTAFYPPHYTNEVKLTTDDVDFKSEINYLSLDFNDKTYYYFIDDIEYISENMVKLYITMDTIQTYMFNIRINSAIIERKFINRWTNDNKINRNYLREDVSNEEFIPIDFTIVNGDISKWSIIGKKTEQLTIKQISGETNYYLDDNQTLIGAMSNIPTSCTYGIVPIVPRTNSNATDCYYSNTGTSETMNANAGRFNQATYNVAITKSWCVDMYVCPFDCIMGFVFNSDGTSIGIDNNRLRAERLDIDQPLGDTAAGDWLISNNKATESIGHNVINVFKYDVCWKKHVTTLNFIKNANSRSFFDSKYVPALIDNNYVRFTFGSYYANTTYPLYMLQTPTLYNWYTFILDSGARVYLINEHSDRIDDVYRVGVTDTNIINLALKNNAWENYVSQNRSRWVGAIGQTAIDIASKGATTGLRNSFIDRDINNIRFDPKSYTPKRGRLSKKSQRQIDALAKQKGLNEGMFAIDAGSSAVNGLIGQAMADINAYVAPTTMKSSANTDGMIDKAAWIFAEVEYVRDFSQCAHYYHRNGYRVDEYVNNIQHIFDYVYNRVYYNIVKMSSIELHLANVLEDETTIDTIKERLEEGVRLWTTDTTYHDIMIEDVEDVDFTQGTHTLELYFGDYVSIDRVVVTKVDGDVEDVTINSATYTRPGIVTVSYTATTNAVVTIEVLIEGDYVYNQRIGDFRYDNVELDYLQ